MKAFIQFKKPIVVAINGPALGLGASILPLCDIVWASEKAWFQTPYATIRLTPAGCSSYTFPQILGVALVRPSFSCSACEREHGSWAISKCRCTQGQGTADLVDLAVLPLLPHRSWAEAGPSS